MTACATHDLEVLAYLYNSLNILLCGRSFIFHNNVDLFYQASLFFTYTCIEAHLGSLFKGNCI